MAELIAIVVMVVVVALLIAFLLPRTSAYFLGPVLSIFALCLVAFGHRLFFSFHSDGSPAGLLVPGIMWLTLAASAIPGVIFIVVGSLTIRRRQREQSV
jgi:hypothetical protein